MNSNANIYEAINWPEDMAPSRCPIHFTDEPEAAASPETIWSLRVDSRAWPSFHPNVSDVPVLLDDRERLQFGTPFEASLAGPDVLASVEEFEPVTRIAWGGGRKAHPDARASHAWILTPTVRGTHLWTEDTLKGPL